MTFDRYKCHKEVEAAKVVLVQEMIGQIGADLIREQPRGAIDQLLPIHVTKAYLAKHEPEPPGYWVRYADGYQSWSPVEVFEAGYTKIANARATRASGIAPPDGMGGRMPDEPVVIDCKDDD